jgi:hypothetical protein
MPEGGVIEDPLGVTLGLLKRSGLGRLTKRPPSILAFDGPNLIPSLRCYDSQFLVKSAAVYLLGAVCPERDVGVALVLPTVGAAAMQAMLDELAQAVRPGAHARVLIDRTGGPIAKTVTVPANLTPLVPPPYSPELNAIERVWLHLRERFLSPRLWPTHDDILHACCAAWDALLDETGRIRSSAPSIGNWFHLLSGLRCPARLPPAGTSLAASAIRGAAPGSPSATGTPLSRSCSACAFASAFKWSGTP